MSSHVVPRIEEPSSLSGSGILAPSSRRTPAQSSRMQYRSRPVSVAVDPISLVISECIAITSAISKAARSTHSSVSAILGGTGPPLALGPPSPSPRRKNRGGAGGERASGDGTGEFGPANRWGLRGKKGKSMADNPLISGFGRLRHELQGVRDIHKFDSLTLLYPFLQIIQAERTAASITLLSLRAIRKFLAYGFICPESPRFALAMQSLSHAITHCQFDISDSSQGEVVLLMILNLMEDMLSGPGGDILSDESVCDMMGRGLTICSHARFSEVLRQTAEASMVRMCQIIFEDLKHLEEEAGDDADALEKTMNGDMEDLKMDPSLNGTGIAMGPDTRTGTSTPSNMSDKPRLSADKARDSSDSSGVDEKKPLTRPAATSDAPDEKKQTEQEDQGAEGVERPNTSSSTTDEGSQSIDLRPYSLPSVRELFRVLVDFLDPHQKKHPDAMRVMALRIIHVALEVAGPSIARHPALATVAEDRLCCYLFQLVRSDNMAILQESLIVASTLLSTCRGVLKLQQELYLCYLINCLHPAVDIPREVNIDPALYAGIPRAPSGARSGRATPVPLQGRQQLGLEGGARKPDARQAMVENIGVLARMPTFMVELFVNYDCDANHQDLCEDLIGLLSRNALPDSATWSTTSVPPLCLDALLRFIQFIAERLDEAPVLEGYVLPEELRESRKRKKIIVKGATKFNENARGGLAYLHEKGIIADINNPKDVAMFLRGTSRLSKKALGDYLSKLGNEAILDAFMDCFDFASKRVDEALRVLLESFRLPGESPLIERIVTTFSEKYCDRGMPEDVADKDAVFILTYAIILLNTDQHNPNLKSNKRMTVEDFSRNLRGQNAGENFKPEFLQAIYDTIKTNEIILPDEHDNEHAFDYAWRELLVKTDTAGPLVVCETNIYDADMFDTTWKPIISTLSYVFMSATDDTVFSRIVQGFDECARIAARYGNSEALDQIIFSLSHMTTLATDNVSNTSLNTEVQVEDNSVMVSELAVKLGRDFRAQLATLVLFRVVTQNESVIRKSWKNIIRIWLNLFVNSLIPPFFSSDTGRVALPPIPLQNPNHIVDRGAKKDEGGFFSTFTSYISSYAADDPPEPSDEELESTLCTVDCVNACHMGDVFANVAQLRGEGLEALVAALLDELPEENDAGVVISVKTEISPPASPPQSSKASANVKYDPALVYIIEFCTVLVLRDEDTTKNIGERVVKAIYPILRDVTQYHSIVVGRAVYYLLSLLKRTYDYDFVRVPVLLHAISSFSKDTLRKTSALVLKGLKLCIAEPGSLRSEIMTSPDFWVILRTLASYPNSAATVFEILASGVSGTPPAILADNYEAAISLLNQYASAASAKSAAEQKPDKRQQQQQQRKPARPTKQDKTSEDAAVQRGVRAIDMIYNMTSRIPHLMKQSALETNEAWSAYWLPIFQALTTQCMNPCREVRHLAFSSLQRSLLSPELTSNDHSEWTAIFGEVLFPLILKLLKPEVYQSDRDGMSETRVQAASLLCKVYLRYLTLLSEWEGMEDLWLKIIDIMDRLLNSGQGDSLEEAVVENLKNVLLFMVSSGYLAPPSKDPSREKVWTETWKRIDRFLPELKSELALDEPEPSSAPPPAPAPAPAEGGNQAVGASATTPAVVEDAKEGPKKEEGQEALEVEDSDVD